MILLPLLLLHTLTQCRNVIVNSHDQSHFLKRKMNEINLFTLIELKSTYRLEISGSLAPEPDHVTGNAQHRREGSEPTEAVRPQRIFIRQVLDRGPLDHVEEEHSHANGRSRHAPAELPPAHRVVADHVLDSVVEPAHAVRPRNGDALEEHEEEQAEPTHRVRVENLEDVHATLEPSLQYQFDVLSLAKQIPRHPLDTHLSDTSESDEIAEHADD